MRMEARSDVQTVDPLIFYATGQQPEEGNALANPRPTLLAAYSDLPRLRYDFPLVLTADETAPIRSLSSVVDALLQKIAPPGVENERLRRSVLRVEREIRMLSADGTNGLLSELWDNAAAQIEPSGGTADDSLRVARGGLDVDGRVLDCQPAAVSDIVGHLWSAVQNKKARNFHAAVGRLAARLADILRADYLRSAEGRSAGSLQVTFGPKHQSLFDFDAMAAVLPKSSSRDALSDSRRRRIEWTLSVLKRQRFFPAPGGSADAGGFAEPYCFRFETCGDALTAYRARFPELVELVKAMTIAELEIDGAYIEARHDAYFSGFGACSLGAQDIARFPDYLLILDEGPTPFDNTGLLAVLSSAIPLKIMVNAGNLVAGTSAGDDPDALGVRSTHLAGLVTGLGNVFVVQSTSSNLYQLRERFLRGLEYAGPALFSIYTGFGGRGLPAYLRAAAAMESRAFPAFSYDPSAGSDLASRFSLENNPQPEADWTTHPLEHADFEMQRVKLDVAFTFVDFLVCDPQNHHHFMAPPVGFELERMTPAAQLISQPADQTSDRVPYALVADHDNVLSRLVVDKRAITAARQCLDNWRWLQEMGGVHNSHAERTLRRERQVWEEQYRRETEQQGTALVTAAASPPAEQSIIGPASGQDMAPPEHVPDAAFIETERCSTCNECTQINDRMFAYNANKQAYIANIGAGTYAQLVDAAESCQLGIIHPGKPLNAAEPGLDDLMKRAEPFQ
jgi:hypothetical protein